MNTFEKGSILINEKIIKIKYNGLAILLDEMLKI